MVVLSLISAIGLGLGKVHVCGISLGVTFVFFAGILAGHFGLSIDPQMLNYAESFGLVIFVYALGLQVGPGFFSSFRKGGVQLNMLALGVVLLNLPLALIGGVFALRLTTGEVSIPAIIGFISLFGIATRNGMLLLNRYNQLRDAGTTLRESIVEGSLDRLNPILMTALTSALALIPLALRGDLPGNEIQSPMAKVILGGLLTSTFLNAFIIPIVYEWMHRHDKPANPENR